MKIDELHHKIVLVSGELCSGKGHYCAAQYPDYYHLPVSSVVQQLTATTARSELADTKHLEAHITQAIIEEISKHRNVVVDGIRQVGIIEALQRHFGRQIVDIIWLDVPVDVRRQRFLDRKATKDDKSFDVASKGDISLGIGDVEQFIRNNGRVVPN